MKILYKFLAVILTMSFVLSMCIMPVSASSPIIPFNSANIQILDAAQGTIRVSGKILNDPDPILVNRYVTIIVLPSGAMPAEYDNTLALATAVAEVDGSFSVTFTFKEVGIFSFYASYEDYTTARADIEIKGIASAAYVVKNIQNGSITKGNIAGAIATHGQMGVDLTRFPVGFDRDLFEYRIDKNRADIDVSGTDVQVLESFYALLDRVEDELAFVKEFNAARVSSEYIRIMKDNIECLDGISFDIYDTLGEVGKAAVAEYFAGKTYANADDIKADFAEAVEVALGKVEVSGECGDNLVWTLNKLGALVISGEGAMSDYSKALNVPWYSERENIKRVIIEEGVTSIGDYAFSGCHSLARVQIAGSVISIGNRSFTYCDSLEDVYYNGLADQWCNIAVGSYNELLDSVKLHFISGPVVLATGKCGTNAVWTLDESGLLVISGEGAMREHGASGAPWYSQRTSVENVVIEDGITTIAGCAFEACSNMMSVTIPDSVAVVGECAFYGCEQLTYVYYHGTEKEWNNINVGAYNTSLVRAIVYFAEAEPEVVASGECGESATWMLDGNGLLVISGEGEMWPDAPWYDYKDSINSVIVEHGVTTIGEYAFYGCYGLNSIELPDTITTIGDDAFYGCSGLTSIKIPYSVEIIGDYAFANCNNLTDVIYTGDEENWAMMTIGAYNNWFVGANISFEERSIIAEGVCGYDLLWELDSCGTLTISGSGNMSDYSEWITNAPWYAHRDSVKKVVIKDGVTSVGNYAFYQCANLTAVTMPGSIDRVGDGAFFGCVSLPRLSIADETMIIGDYALYNCVNLKNITIPDSVTAIGKRAFDGCDKLADVYYSGNEAKWEGIKVASGNESLLNAALHLGGMHTVTTVSDDGKTFTVKGHGIKEGSSIILATYNNEDFVEIKVAKYESKDITFKTTGDYTIARVFVWGTAYTPLCKEEVLE